MGKLTALAIAKYHFGAGDYKARCLRKWRNDFLIKRILPSSSQGKHQKSIPFIENEDFRAACLLFLRSKRIEQLNAIIFGQHLQQVVFPDIYGYSAAIIERTARNWMNWLGFEYKELKKGSYVDGHDGVRIKNANRCCGISEQIS